MMFSKFGGESSGRAIATVEPPYSNDSQISVELLRDWQQTGALAVTWDALVEASPSPSIFMTWDYISTWWHNCRDHQELCILVARNNAGEICGIAPLMIGTGDTVARRAVRQLSLIGTARHPISQLMDLIVRADHRREVARAFARYILDDLSGEWDILHLPFIEQTSVLMTDVLPYVHELGCTWSIDDYEPAPFVQLEGSWDNYLANRSARWRKNLRRRWRSLTKAHNVEILQADRNIGVEEAVDAFMCLHDQRWGETSLALATPSSRRLLRQLAPTLAAKGRLLLVLIRVDGIWAAGGLDFVYCDKIFGYQSGWHQRFAEFGMGTIVLAEEMKWAYENKLKAFDLMGGEGSYKECLMTHSRELVNIDVINPASLRGQLFTRLRTLKHNLLANQTDSVSSDNS